jgi:predicted amidohydrolase YtcJ
MTRRARYTLRHRGIHHQRCELFGHAEIIGSIEAGKIADLIVLNQNIVELAEGGHPERIGETQVQMTVFDGKVVFER